MNPFERFSLSVWLLLTDLPSISAARLLMPAVFLASWTILRLTGTGEIPAFVWSGVLAQTAHVWAVLPLTAWLQRRAVGRAGNTLFLVLAAFIGAFALQIWWCDPWMSQRVLTVCCALYAAIMALAIWRGGETIDAIMPIEDRDEVMLAFRQHLAKLNALIAILFLVLNEALLATGAPLDARVAVLALLPILLHYVYHITLRLTCPYLGEEDD